MILDNISEYKKYVSIATSFQVVDIEPFKIRAIDEFTSKYVGNLHQTLADDATGDNADIKNEARKHLSSAIANFAFYLYSPYEAVMQDSSGITVTNSETKKTAEWWQLKDIRRDRLRSGHKSMDMLLTILEANPTVFTEWTTSYSTINNELIVSNTTTFNKYYHIFESRQTYLALQPAIRQIEDQYVATFLCPELIAVLKSSTATGNVLLLKTTMQKVIVAFTVAKVANEGLFELNATGLQLNFESGIDYRKNNVDYGLPKEQLQNLILNQINNGTNYLNIAKDIITSNLSDFNQCENPLIKSSTSGSGFTPYDTKGVFSL